MHEPGGDVIEAWSPGASGGVAIETDDAEPEIEVRADEEIPYPGFYPIVLRCLHQRHPLRAWCLRVITWPWFERISMLVILVNCVTLGMYQPCVDEECLKTRCQVLHGFDHAVFAFFACELAAKVCAMGLWGQLGYLGDSWNRLDFFIVLAGLLEYLPQTKDLSLTAIRTIRVLRPLRAINRIPSMRILVMLLLDTLPMLGNVLLLCFFVFFIFGIIGVQLWKGVLRNRCFLGINDTISHPGINLTEYYQLNSSMDSLLSPKDFICSLSDANGIQTCDQINPTVMWLATDSYLTCNRSADPFGDNYPTNDSCVNWNQYYSVCNASVSNPYMGSINFDNIGFAWVAIFQVISLESWVDIMYYIQDAHSFWAWIYFVSLIVIGSFFMINLCLVVIATQFSETKKREVEKMLQERKRYKSTSSLTSSNDPGSCYGQIVKLLFRQARRLQRSLCRRYQELQRQRAAASAVSAAGLEAEQQANAGRGESPVYRYGCRECQRNETARGSTVPGQQLSPPRASPEVSDFVDEESSASATSGAVAARRVSLQPPMQQLHQQQQQNKQQLAANDAPGSRRSSSWYSTGCRCHRGESSASSLNCRSLLAGYRESDLFPGWRLAHWASVSSSIAAREVTAAPQTEHPRGQLFLAPLGRLRSSSNLLSSIWKSLRRWVKHIIDHRFFQRGILIAILINTMSMGIDFHNQPQTLTDIIEYSNVIFCVVFALEMLLKLVGDGFISYVSSGFNVFDASIVILSVFELLQGHGSGLSVLRTFRLLRILKLVRFLPALRQQLFVMLKTMDNVATFFALLVLFIFIFSVLGMTLFGGKFCWHPDGSTCTCAERADPDGDCSCDRANFDTIMWSLVTVFQILTQEDWNTVLYNGMARTSPWAALYFIALMTFGNYVLFNLLVAILVEGFSSERKYYIMEKYRLKKKVASSAALNSVRGADSGLGDGSEPDVRAADEANRLADDPTVGDAAGPAAGASEQQPQQQPAGALIPPIITHTAATPQPTPPQGSPAIEASVEAGRFKCPAGNDEAAAAAAAAAVDLLQKRQQQQQHQLGLSNAFRFSSTSIASIDRSLSNDKSVSDSSPGRKARSNSQSENFGFYSVCNGHPTSPATPTLGPNGRIFRPVTPNSLGSRQLSNHQSQHRRSSFSGSHRTVTPQDSIGSSWNKFDPSEECANAQLGSVQHQGKLDDAFWPQWLARWFPAQHSCFKYRENYSLYLLAPDNRIRILCQKMVVLKSFDYTVLFFIALNCITLAMERPSIPPDSIERKFLSITNDIFTWIFTVEMSLKVAAKGLLIGPHAYLKSGWNVMDGALVAVSLIDALMTIIAGSSNRIFGILRVFRLLRTLRPLRVISRAPGLKLVVQTLLSSLRPIGNIVLICCTFFIIFGILGVQLFKGKFYYCDGPDVANVVNITDCLADKRNKWVKHKYNFDNLGQALMALFVLSSKDGWVQIMYTGLDAVGENMQPKENHNEWLLLYFISFLLLVGFFVLNMFVGVVVENFHKCRASQEKEEKARRAAKRARRMEKRRKKIREQPYWSAYSPWRLRIHKLVDSKYFDLVIATIIGLNVITMAMEFYLMPKELELALKATNYVFTTVFIIEAAFKIIALGIKRYFIDRWNQLDVLIVLLSVSGIVLEEMEAKIIPINPTIVRVMRVLRIARVLKLLKMAKGIRALLDTVIQALPQVGNLGLLFFLLFFIFAALGVELFGRLECSLDNPCVGLSRHAHFENFGMAFLTLFRIATGDNWNGIMKDTLREKCDWSDSCVKNCCVSPIIAPIYFVVFVLMAQFVLVNVVVAVLMKHLEESHKMMSDDDELEKEIRRELEEENRENQRQLEMQECEMKESQESLPVFASDGDPPQPQQTLLLKLPTLVGTQAASQRVASPRIQSCRFSCSDRVIERRLSSIYDRTSPSSAAAASAAAADKRRRYSEVRVSAFEIADETASMTAPGDQPEFDTRPVTEL